MENTKPRIERVDCAIAKDFKVYNCSRALCRSDGHIDAFYVDGQGWLKHDSSVMEYDSRADFSDCRFFV